MNVNLETTPTYSTSKYVYVTSNLPLMFLCIYNRKVFFSGIWSFTKKNTLPLVFIILYFPSCTDSPRRINILLFLCVTDRSWFHSLFCKTTYLSSFLFLFIFSSRLSCVVANVTVCPQNNERNVNPF